MSATNRWALLSALCVCLCFAVACDDEPDRLDGPVSESDADDEVAERVCYQYEECNCGDFAMVSLTGCETGLQFAWQASSEDAKEDGLTYDGDCLAKRLNAMLDRGCAKPGVGDIPYCVGETCQIFHGTKAEGEECDGGFSRSDCQQGLICLGTCQVPCANTGVNIEEGQVCRDVDAEFAGVCAEDLLCLPDTDDPNQSFCRAAPALGEDCSQAICAEGLFCDFQNGQVCAELVALGGDCIQPLQCESGTCSTEMKCVEPPAIGESCISTCADGAVCMPSAEGASCVAIPQRGDDCLLQSAIRCAEGLVCIDSKCADQPGKGDSCVSSDNIPVQCKSGSICDGMKCIEIPPAVCSDSGGVLY